MKHDSNIINFFLDEYYEGKKQERALMRLDISECIYKAFTAGQPVEKGKINTCFEHFKKWRDDLLKDLNIKKEEENFWKELKKQKRDKKIKKLSF